MQFDLNSPDSRERYAMRDGNFQGLSNLDCPFFCFVLIQLSTLPLRIRFHAADAESFNMAVNMQGLKQSVNSAFYFVTFRLRFLASRLLFLIRSFLFLPLYCYARRREFMKCPRLCSSEYSMFNIFLISFNWV